MNKTGTACLRTLAVTKLVILSALLMTPILLRPVYCNQIQPTETSALSDRDLLNLFGSKNPENSHGAVVEILKRGEHMLPLLLKVKGNENFFYGYGLGHRDSAFLFPMPTGNAKADESRVLTLEVASLYLICSIYYQSLEFSQGPYLTDGTPVKMQRFNTPRRVSSAWRSVEQWYERVRIDGLQTVRSRKDSPLQTSGVHFWGTAEKSDAPN